MKQNNLPPRQNAIETELLQDIDAFLSKSGMAHTTFSFKAMGDPNFVNTLCAGREVRRATRDKVRNFMASYASENAA